jgi:tetratricopeptide (TPR) repeat protein
VEVLEPLATSPDGPRRIKLLYGRLLNEVGIRQSFEQGSATLEEALRILASLGALNLSDLTAAGEWADTADTEARLAWRLGRSDDAERLEKQTVDLAERILARRPGDLQASMDRAEALDLLLELAVEHYHDAEALQLSDRAQRAAEDYIRINPSDAVGRVGLGLTYFHSAALLFHLGHPGQSVEKARAALQQPLQANGTNDDLGPTFLLWEGIAFWQSQRGERAAAEQALQEARRDVDAFWNKRRATELPKSISVEFVEQTVRRVKSAFGENAAVLSMAESALTRLDKIKAGVERLGDAGLKRQWLNREVGALEDSAQAALNLRRYSEAEAAARTLSGQQSELEAAHTSLLSPVGFVDPHWGQVLLAQAEVDLNRREEALKTVEPPLDYYRKLQVQGANHLIFRQHFARALYAQAFAQPTDAAGRMQARDSLEQASRLLTELPEEAQQLHDSKELVSWIEAEQKKLSRGDAPL